MSLTACSCPGGSPWTARTASGLRNTTNTPRRVSVWNAVDGRFLQEFCGTTWYAAMCTNVNPLNPNQAFVLGNICELDWEKGCGGDRHPAPAHHRRGPFQPEHGRPEDRCPQVGNRTLLLSGNSHALIVTDFDSNSARPLAAMGSVRIFAYNPTSWPNTNTYPDIVLKHMTETPEQLEELKRSIPALRWHERMA